MDLDKIRQMDDAKLAEFLRQMSSGRDSKLCVKCKKASKFTIRIENSETLQNKKLCGLCEDCYDDLLNYLGICDIYWDR